MSKTTDEVYVALKRHFKGSLLRPDDAEYSDARRIWNGLVARRPGLIARCNDSSDVQAAVDAAGSAGGAPPGPFWGPRLSALCPGGERPGLLLSPPRPGPKFPRPPHM